MICKYCYQEYDKEKRAKEVYRRKVKNAMASLAKRDKNGNKGGRRKIRNDEQIKLLRLQGKSIRAIAKIIGVSSRAVHRGLCEMGMRGSRV